MQADVAVAPRRHTDPPDVSYRLEPQYDAERHSVRTSAVLLTAAQAQQIVDGLARLGVRAHA